MALSSGFLPHHGSLPSEANWAFWEGEDVPTPARPAHTRWGGAAPTTPISKAPCSWGGPCPAYPCLATHSSFRSRQCGAPTTFLSLERETIGRFNGGWGWGKLIWQNVCFL